MLDFTTDITPHPSMVHANWHLMLEHAARFDAMDNDNVQDGHDGFDLRFGYSERDSTSHTCGSAMCIGGWLSVWAQNTEMFWDTAITRIWGVPYSKSDLVGWPTDENRDASPQQAAELIRHLVRTGEVDWPRAMEVA